MPKKVQPVLIDGVLHRICCVCKVPKILEAYHKDLFRGQQSKCIECCKAYRKKYYADRVQEKKRPEPPVIAPAPIAMVKPTPLQATLRTSKFLKYANAAD